MKVKFADICIIKSSKRIFENEYVDDGVPFIRGQEISDGSLLAENATFECYISHQRYNELKNKYGVPVLGDILITAVGTIGNLYYVDKKRDFYFKDGNVILFTSFSEKVNSKYLYYYMRSPLFKKQLEYAMIGAVQKALTMVMLNKIEIDLPTIEKQNAIVRILEKIDSKISNNNKINAELEYMAKTLYDYWFLQFEFPNEEGKPYKSSGGKMVWNEELKREIPEGWEIGNLYDIADFINGLACQKYRPVNDTEKLPVIKITEMHDGITDNTEFVRSDIPENNIINDGDILFSWSATLETMIWTGGKCGLNQHIFKVIPNNISKYYVFMQLSSYIGNFVKMAEARKTTMGHITTEHLKQSKIVLPNKAIAEMFDKKISDVFRMIIKNNQEKRELMNVRDFLLPLLMNGQVGFKEK